MEKNTVILSVKDYNEMRDFQDAIKQNNAVGVFWGWDDEFESCIYSKDEALLKVSEANLRLKDKIKQLENPEGIQLSIEEIKKLSWLEFRKWKKRNK